MLRRPAALALLSLSLAVPTALAQENRLPTDAVGSLRAAAAPYVPPADHQGRLSGPNFSLHCMVSCPSESIEVVEFREGGSSFTSKSPGRYHVGDVTLCGDKKTMKPVLDWFRALKSGQLASFRKDLLLEILSKGADGREVAPCQFNLSRTWPHEVDWSDNGSACVQLAVEAVERVDP